MTATNDRDQHADLHRDLLRDVRPADRWLVVVAHPDDEAFGCGSVIARAARRGADVTVACATRGEAGEIRPELAGCEDLGALREAELRRASAVLGAARVVVLGYRDSGFDGEAAAGSLVAAPVAAVAGVLRRICADLRPDVVITLDGSDGHRDHVRVRDAVRAALCAWPERRAALWEHTLPASLLRRWLRETAASRGEDVYHALEADAIGRPDAEITDVLDVCDVLALREAAIAEHRSQTSPFEGLSPELREAFLVTDHLVHVPLPPVRYWDHEQAAWRPCPAAG